MEDPQVFYELRLDLAETVQDTLVHPANVMTSVVAWFVFFLFFLLFRDLIPEPSMEELHCRFLGVVEGEVVAAAAGCGGECLVGGASNGSGGGGVPSLHVVLRMSWLEEAWILVEVWMVLGSLGDEGVDREGPGWGVDFRWRSSRFLNSMSF